MAVRVSRTVLGRYVLPLALLIILLALPAAHPSMNIIRLLLLTAIYTTTSVGWNLLGGFAGQVSFGFAVFYGLGAYTTALMMHQGINPYLGFLGAGFVAVIASFIVGLPTFRLRGPYFAIATIGVTEAVRVVMNNLNFTGGASGSAAGSLLAQAHEYRLLFLGALVLSVPVVAVGAIARSRYPGAEAHYEVAVS